MVANTKPKLHTRALIYDIPNCLFNTFAVTKQIWKKVPASAARKSATPWCQVSHLT